MSAHDKSAALRGISKLSIDGVKALSELVEDLHQSIASLGGLLGPAERTRTQGLTGLVYASIRGVSTLVGAGLDVALKNMDEKLPRQVPAPGRDAALAALNGVLGDHLAATDNPLATQMQIKWQKNVLRGDEPDFLQALQKAQGRILVLLHGSCMNDQQWLRQGHDHGLALQRDLGLVPLYLLYNSGLHISENGKQFSILMNNLCQRIDRPLQIDLVAHSMGGLVVRSAVAEAERASRPWRAALKKIVFLGTPHHGAALERGGNWLDFLLKISPYSAPFARLGKIRSAGVTDLRYGFVHDQDWQGQDRFAFQPDARQAQPLPKDVQCFAIAGSMTKFGEKTGAQIPGDGMVAVRSAFGQHDKAQMDLQIDPVQRALFYGVHHLDLLGSVRVYEQLKLWLA